MPRRRRYKHIHVRSTSAIHGLRRPCEALTTALPLGVINQIALNLALNQDNTPLIYYRTKDMKKYVAYGIGAALVDTEIKVQDSELAEMNVDKGMMTLVDADRQAELLGHLESIERLHCDLVV